jgi:hypothetical protein
VVGEVVAGANGRNLQSNRWINRFGDPTSASLKLLIRIRNLIKWWENVVL